MAEMLHHVGSVNLRHDGPNYLSSGAGFKPSTGSAVAVAASDSRMCHQQKLTHTLTKSLCH